MTILVVGASGATGQQLVQQLLNRGQTVRMIVRSPDNLPAPFMDHPNLIVIYASLLALDDAKLCQHVKGCDAIASCLGHNLTWKGIFGPPRKLVTEATQRLCLAIRQTQGAAKPIKFVLMNTAGNRNRDLQEPISLAQRCIISLIRLLLPPHADNEMAADYLRTQIGQGDDAIAWVVVRPDDLVDEEQVTAYEVHASPTRSAIFNAGSTSRINVGHFMAELITNDDVWQQWQGQMPVIYNKTSPV